MKYNPTIHCNSSGNAITSKPKIIAMTASTGFDTVTPIFLSPFSIVPVMFITYEEFMVSLFLSFFIDLTGVGYQNPPFEVKVISAEREPTPNVAKVKL
jgi:hypothetical protein